MEIVLIKDVKGLGKMGDVCKVSDGNAINYLIPNGLAVDSKNAIGIKIQNDIKNKSNVKQKENKHLIEEINKIPELIEIKVKVNENNDLFSSIKPIDISNHLSKKGINIPHNYLKFERIKHLGSFDVSVSFKDIEKNIKICVIKE